THARGRRPSRDGRRPRTRQLVAPDPPEDQDVGRMLGDGRTPIDQLPGGRRAELAGNGPVAFKSGPAADPIDQGTRRWGLRMDRDDQGLRQRGPGDRLPAPEPYTVAGEQPGRTPVEGRPVEVVLLQDRAELLVERAGDVNDMMTRIIVDDSHVPLAQLADH